MRTVTTRRLAMSPIPRRYGWWTTKKLPKMCSSPTNPTRLTTAGYVKYTFVVLNSVYITYRHYRITWRGYFGTMKEQFRRLRHFWDFIRAPPTPGSCNSKLLRFFNERKPIHSFSSNINGCKVPKRIETLALKMEDLFLRWVYSFERALKSRKIYWFFFRSGHLYGYSSEAPICKTCSDEMNKRIAHAIWNWMVK